MDALSSSFLLDASFQRSLLHLDDPQPRLPPLPTSAALISNKDDQPLPPIEPKLRQRTAQKIRTYGTPPAAALCNFLDGLIDAFVDPPSLRPSNDPRHVLSSNFSPVPELPPTPCTLTRGTIPQPLIGGAYVRNGPNPQHLPRGPHHLVEGDGMIHSLLLSPSGGTLSSRFVHTYRYSMEHSAAPGADGTYRPLFPKVLSGFHGLGGIAPGAVSILRILTGQMNPARGIGLANTSLLYFANRLYALGEPDLPYLLEIDGTTGDTSTVDRCDFDGKLALAMTAHPKVDPNTGEMFAFRSFPAARPYVTYFRFDREGNKVGPDVPIFSVTRPMLMHDFAVTENYAVFNDTQIVMQPMEMILGGGPLFGVDPRKVARLGLLPRYATSESAMRWFDVPGFNPMHAVNAWEEDRGDAVVLIAPNILSIEHFFDRLHLIHCCVEMVRIDLKANTISRTPLSSYNLDMGVINPSYATKKNRFVYLGIGDPMPKFTGIVKMDLEKAGRGDCVVGRRIFGGGCFGGEPFFVAEGDGCGEDDGYVLSYVHDEGRDESRFLVMDAKSPDLEVLAEVLLPQRVPYGTHGLFISRKSLQSPQKKV